MDQKPLDAWSKKSLSVHLSHERREKLRQFAQHGMTPVEAVFSLIDSSGMDWKNPLDPYEKIRTDLDRLSKQVDAQAAVSHQCAVALKSISEAHGPIHQMMAALQTAETQSEVVTTISALDSSAWLNHVISATRSQDKNQIVVVCRCLHIETTNRRMSIKLSTAINVQTQNGQIQKPLPELQVTNLPIQWHVAQSLNNHSDSDLILLCSRSAGSGWQGIILNARKEQILTFPIK